MTVARSSFPAVSGPLESASLASMDALLVPGWHGSEPEHWQSDWERQFPRWARVKQTDWDRPCPRAWTAELSEALCSQRQPVLVIAHSLGVWTVVRWAAEHPEEARRRLRGALLVTPPNLQGRTCAAAGLGSFDSTKQKVVLPFDSLVVASENDPYAPAALPLEWAKRWGSEYVNVGRQGHINVASGHGPWPEGLRVLGEWLARQA